MFIKVSRMIPAMRVRRVRHGECHRFGWGCVGWHVVLLVAAGAMGLAGQNARLFVSGASSKGYVVGAKLPPSGVFELVGGEWAQRGFTHPAIAAIDYDRGDPSVLYLAGGNGCIRAAEGGRTWRITTSWDMTELLDVAVDPHHADTVFIALPDGIARTADGGRTWRRVEAGLARKFTKAIRVDRARAGHLIAGTESGLFVSVDNGATWRRTGDGGVAMITHLAQSPHDARVWLAGTQGDGVVRSDDGGRTWRRVAALPLGETYYQVAFDPGVRGRVAVCGWKGGVRVSEDGGATFAERSAGLPSAHVWSVAFEPGRPGRLLAGVHEEAVYASDDAGLHWVRFGLPGWIVTSFAFVPEGRR